MFGSQSRIVGAIVAAAAILANGWLADASYAQIWRKFKAKSCCPQTVEPVSPTEPVETAPDQELVDLASAFDTGASSPFTAPNMIGDSPGGACGTVLFEGLVIGSVNHPIYSCSRTKISENNSPVPRDRVYFTYQHFHNGTLLSLQDPDTQGSDFHSLDVNRYTFGFEKTWLDGLISTEIRIPINGELTTSPTLDYINETAQSNTNVNFGNISTALKAILWQRRNFAMTGGLLVHFPTAPDVTVTAIENVMINQAPVGFIHQYNYSNDAVIVSPFFGAVGTPTPRLFYQGFAQFDFDLNGNDFTFTPGPDGVPGTPTGFNLDEQALMRLDIGAGYWLYNNPGGFVSGVAQAVEVHYTHTLEDSDTFDIPEPVFGANVTVGNVANRLDVVNLTLATTVELQGRSTLAAGVVLPLNGGDDKAFEVEFNLQLNYRFGPQGRVERTPSSF